MKDKDLSKPNKNNDWTKAQITKEEAEKIRQDTREELIKRYPWMEKCYKQNKPKK